MALVPDQACRLRDGTRRAPGRLLLVLTAAVYGNAALAGESEQAADVFVKHYTKEELRLTLPANPRPELHDQVLTHLRATVTDLATQTARPEVKARLEKLSTLGQANGEWALGLAITGEATTARRADVKGLTLQTRQESGQALGRTVMKRSPWLRKLQSGLDFQVGTGGGPKRGGGAAVRYGLALKEIRQITTGQARASLTDTEDELRYAGKAEPVWTIAPIFDGERPDLFQLDESDHGATPGGGWMPRAAFKGNIGLAHAPGTGDQGRGAPPVQVTVEQVDGLYKLTQVRSLGPAGKDGAGTGAAARQTTHTLRLPVGGIFEVTRDYDGDLRAQRTGISGGDHQAGRMELSRLHAEGRLRTAWSRAFGRAGRHRLGITHDSAATSAPDNVAAADRAAHMAERVSVSVASDF